MDEQSPETPPPDLGAQETWVGLQATAMQAMEWGIDLCGQLATVHAEGIVVGGIGPDTITRTRFGQPKLPEPDVRAAHDNWVDVSALADAIGSIVADPPPEFTNALLAPYASAVALGQELQDAQTAMGLPVAPIPYEAAPIANLGGLPYEMPPEPRRAPQPALPEPEPADDLGFDPAELFRNPNLRALLAIVVIVAVAAVAIGIGWR